MARRTLVLNAKNAVADTVESFFVAETTSITILGFTVTNVITASASYKAYIYSASEDPDPIMPQKIVVRDRFDLGPAIIGLIIPKGGSLRMESSTAGALQFNVVGE